MAIKEKLKDLPDGPGVYVFKDERGKALYVGKATSLKKRVSSYFRKSPYYSPKAEALILNVKDLEYIRTPSEAQALLLEANLIKENQPRYNVEFRDDKSFPKVKITNEDFSAIFICRPKRKNKARYFGPYTNAKLLRQALRAIRRVFPFRSCRTMPKSVCLNYYLNLCPAPCIGKINRRDYREIIEKICLFLEGKLEELIKDLSIKMEKEAKEKNFERATKLRDQIKALSSLIESCLPAGQTGEWQVGSKQELEELKKRLNLPNLPRRIEAFDISNIFGKEAVGSMVWFYDGKPNKNNFRRFRIKTVEEIDDYKMLAEVIQRRYRRVKKEKLPYPDLIIIDGGKGHLSVAKRELKRSGLSLPLMGIAKGEEQIYVVGKRTPLILPSTSAALHLLQRIRDEAHRFALAYHHILRRKKTLESR
jgi:excinuclease ABC subunit C